MRRLPPSATSKSVDLSDLAEQEGVEALHSLVLDFDQDGRLRGIEVVGDALRVLRRHKETQVRTLSGS